MCYSYVISTLFEYFNKIIRDCCVQSFLRSAQTQTGLNTHITFVLYNYTVVIKEPAKQLIPLHASPPSPQETNTIQRI